MMAGMSSLTIDSGRHISVSSDESPLTTIGSAEKSADSPSQFLSGGFCFAEPIGLLENNEKRHSFVYVTT